jgi:uncharacterized delta-60 repeat protein
MKTLYDPHLRAFTVDQLSHLSEDKIDWLIGKKLQITRFTELQKDAILARKAFFVNSAPTVAHAIANKSATEDVAFSFTVPSNTFADADSGDALSYTASRADGSTLPSWLSFNANTRTFSGTPGNADPGEINLKVTATDRVGASVSSAFKLTVANVNDAPTGSVGITGTPTQGQTLTAGNSLADVDGLGSISYQWLADGSDISGATTSSLLLTQAQVGKAISVRASYTDLFGTAESKTSTATALVANVNDVPTVANPITDQNATEGVAFTFTVPSNTFADVDSGDTLSYAATRADDSALPSWLQFNANTRTFSGTPGYADSGELNLKVTASDLAGVSVSSVFKVTVNASSDGLRKEWTHLLGTSAFDGAYATTTGTDGAIYIAGSTEGNLDGQVNSGYTDAFITKINPDGEKQWTRLIRLSGFNFSIALTTGADSSIYLAGGGLSWDGSTNVGSVDAFITKFNSNGEKQWTQMMGSSSWDMAYALTTGADDSIYVAGLATESFDGQTNSGFDDAFIAKFNSDGEKEWTQLLGSSRYDGAEALTTGADGAIYVGGRTGGSLDGQANGGGTDAFVTKFNPDGQKQWTQLLGSSSMDWGNALTTGTDGSIYIAGFTLGSLDGQTNSGGADAFITKFNPNGTKAWTKLLGGSGDEIARALTTGADGSIYLSGHTSNSLDGQATSGGVDAFIAKFNPNGEKEWTKLLGSNLDDYARSITIGAEGSIYVSGYTTGSLDGQVNSGDYDAFITKYSV